MGHVGFLLRIVNGCHGNFAVMSMLGGACIEAYSLQTRSKIHSDIKWYSPGIHTDKPYEMAIE